MANHYVAFQTPVCELGKADVVFTIKDDNGMIGTLKVSHGSIEWRPANNSYSQRVSWKKFGELMAEKGRKVLSK